LLIWTIWPFFSSAALGMAAHSGDENEALFCPQPLHLGKRLRGP